MISTLRLFHRTFLSGWWRWPKESFDVLVGPNGGPLTRLRAPFGTYFADPFVWESSGECWVFVEQYSYSKNRARLVARRLSGGPLIHIPLVDSRHASFPCLFEANGLLCMIPETSQTGTIDLYACDRFPDRWRHVRRLAEYIDAADTAPVFHAGRWWLFSSVRHSPADDGRRSFSIFHTSDLFTESLVDHPINNQRVHFESPFSSGRNAGGIITIADGSLVRPFQNNQRYYGEALGWARIDTLSTSDYRETILDTPPEGFSGLPRLPLHHVSANSGWIACDTRTRIPPGIRSKRR